MTMAYIVPEGEKDSVTLLFAKIPNKTALQDSNTPKAISH